MIRILIVLLLPVAMQAQNCEQVCLFAEVGDNSNGQDVNQITGELIYILDGVEYSETISDNLDAEVEPLYCWDMPVEVSIVSFKPSKPNYYTSTSIQYYRPDTVVYDNERYYLDTIHKTVYLTDTVYIENTVVEDTKVCPETCTQMEGQVIDALGRVLYQSPIFEELPSAVYWIRGYCVIRN